jgi:hypothetical protein
LYATFVADKSNADAASEASKNGQAWSRIWQYVCWLVSDASALLRDKAAGPYRYEDVLLATRALSQNLLVHRDIIHGYSLSVIWLLGDLLRDVTVECDDALDQSSDEQFRTTTVRLLHRSSGQLAMLSELIEALHQARDGVAHREIKERVWNSESKSIRRLLPLIDNDGRFQSTLDARGDQSVAKLWLQRTRTK